MLSYNTECRLLVALSRARRGRFVTATRVPWANWLANARTRVSRPEPATSIASETGLSWKKWSSKTCDNRQRYHRCNRCRDGQSLSRVGGCRRGLLFRVKCVRLQHGDWLGRVVKNGAVEDPARRGVRCQVSPDLSCLSVRRNDASGGRPFGPPPHRAADFRWKV